MLVSINIVAYNEEKNIEKSLESALRQSYKPVEVLLIDNASRDSTVEVAEAMTRGLTPAGGQTPNFTIVKNPKNFGFGGGHNVGFRKSSGDFVLCLNADCQLSRDYVQWALEVFLEDPRVGACQGKLLNRKTGKIDTTGLVIFKNRRVINRGQGDLDTGQFEKLEEVWGADGAAPIYRRTALLDVKVMGEYFDEDFFAYKEDIDLAWRMRLAGWKTMYQPKAVGFHDRSAGEGHSTNPFKIIRARRKVSEFAKFHSFGNQRLMQIKNETPFIFLKHFPRILSKEIVSWAYILLFERYGWKSAFMFFRLLPKALKKRSYVMASRRVSDQTIEQWFM